MNGTASKPMKITPYLLSCGLLLAATTLTSAKPAYVPSTVNLRAAPSRRPRLNRPGLKKPKLNRCGVIFMGLLAIPFMTGQF